MSWDENIGTHICGRTSTRQQDTNWHGEQTSLFLVVRQQFMQNSIENHALRMHINKAEPIIMQRTYLCKSTKNCQYPNTECLRSKFSHPLQCILSINFRTHWKSIKQPKHSAFLSDIQHKNSSDPNLFYLQTEEGRDEHRYHYLTPSKRSSSVPSLKTTERALSFADSLHRVKNFFFLGRPWYS